MANREGGVGRLQSYTVEQKMTRTVPVDPTSAVILKLDKSSFPLLSATNVGREQIKISDKIGMNHKQIRDT